MRAELESGAITPPLSTPSAPTNVTVSTKGYNATEGDGIGDSQARDHPLNRFMGEKGEICLYIWHFKDQ